MYPNKARKQTFLALFLFAVSLYEDQFVIPGTFALTVLLAVEDPFLVVVRDSIIYGISLNPDDKSNDAMVPVAGLQNGYDVDFDDNEQNIYWVEHPVSYCSDTSFPVSQFLICFPNMLQ